MFSGQAERGAQAGEAKFRASLRELSRHHAVGMARQGCQQVRGVYAHPIPLDTAAPSSAPPGQSLSTPGTGQHPPEHAASARPGAGEFGWSPRGAPKDWYPSYELSIWVLPLAVAHICPGVGEGPGCPRCLGAGEAVLGKGFCLSICLCRNLWRNCSAVSQQRMGRQGHVIPKTGCVLSVAEKESQVAQDLR